MFNILYSCVGYVLRSTVIQLLLLILIFDFYFLFLDEHTIHILSALQKGTTFGILAAVSDRKCLEKNIISMQDEE